MFDKFLDTPKEFMVLYLKYLPVGHLKYCLNTSKIDTETMSHFLFYLILFLFFIKKLSNQLFANYFLLI